MRPGFAEYLTLQNPGAAPATATFSFQAVDDGGTPVTITEHNEIVRPRSRVTVDVTRLVTAETPSAVNLSVRVTSDAGIVAERPLYFAADPGLGAAVDGGTVVRG